jgi:pimeloyl-ACP methyl ester carboxylesterase
VPFARSSHLGRLHYADRGETHPDRLPALLIHGAGASSAIWMMVMARLGRFTRVVAVDLPGHGPSPAGESGAAPRIDDYRDAAGTLAAGLCLGRSVLVGHSMGGLVALAAALAWPDKVGGLVLCGAAPRLPVSEALLAVVRDDYDAFPAWLAERALSPAAAPGLRRAFIAAGLVTSRATTLADYAAIAVTDLTSRLPEIKCPVVWLNGADDRIVAAPDAAMLPPNSEQAIVPDAGHLLPIEAPAVVAEAAGRLSLNRA